jgi:hypothetical protein
MSGSGKPSIFAYQKAARALLSCLTDKQKVLLLYYVTKTNPFGEFFGSYEGTRKITGYSNDTIAKANKYFRDNLEILTWDKGHGNQFTQGKNKSNTFRLNLDKMLDLTSEQASVASGPEQRQQNESAASDLESAASDPKNTASDLGIAASGPEPETNSPLNKNPNKQEPIKQGWPPAPFFEDSFVEKIIQQEVNGGSLAVGAVGHNTENESLNAGPGGAVPESPALDDRAGGTVAESQLQTATESHRLPEGAEPEPDDWPDYMPGRYSIKFQGYHFSSWESALEAHPNIQKGTFWVLTVHPDGKKSTGLYMFFKNGPYANARWLAHPAGDEIFMPEPSANGNKETVVQ